MDDFIELNRRFAEFDANSGAELDSLSYQIRSSFDFAKTWQDILLNRCTVIIAEAGMGKSEEFRHQTESFRCTGKVAFFCRLELLATMAFERAVEIGTSTELEAWKKNEQQGYFFLDSVDEAKLANPQDFERAIVRFIDVVEAHKERITVVISTRPHAWQAFSDRNMLSRRLGLAPIEQTRPSGEDDAFDEGADESIAQDGQQAKQSGNPAICILQMLPLDEKQVRVFAKNRNVKDLEAFIEAIERADADMFAMRPADLPALIDNWNSSGKIGRYSEVVAGSIKLKIQEVNPSHQSAAKIGADRAFQGAKMLAAAVTLSRRTSILLPDQSVESSLQAVSIQPQDVLGEWTPGEIQSLLGRALFDESLYGAVRFHHRTAREYLAARWFEGLLKLQKNRRGIEALFFSRPYGTERWVVIPRMKPIVGWLAVWDQRIRDKVLNIDPKVLLEYGDASALDTGTRETLLRRFAERYKDQKYTPISLNTREVRRLADPGLDKAICALLESYREHVDVRNLLLRIIREGRVPGCSKVAMGFALDEKCDAYGRSYAVEAIGLAGTLENKKALAGKVRTNAARLDSQIVAAAVDVLWPGVLSDRDIVSILERVIPPKPFSVERLGHELEDLIGRLPTGKRLMAMLKAVESLVTRRPLHNETYCRISQRYDWLLPLLWHLARRAIKESDAPENERFIVSAILLCAEAEHLERYTGDVRKEVGHVLEGSRPLRYALFWHEVESTRSRSTTPVNNAWQVYRAAARSDFDESDLQHFLDAVKGRPLADDRLVALSVLERIYRTTGSTADILKAITDAVKDEKALQDTLQNLLAPRPLSQTEQETSRLFKDLERKREARKRRDTTNRKKWIERLRANPSQVGDLEIAKDGKIWNNTIWLFNEVRESGKDKSNTRWTVANWQVLEPDFGQQVAESFRDFCQALWRRYEPRLRSEATGDSRSTPWTVIVGLSGLAMESSTSVDWATRLSPEEARLAVRYALNELNGLPDWMMALYQAHPEEVEAMLIHEAEWELRRPSSEGDAHYVISRLQWTAKELAMSLRAKVVSSLQKYPAGNPEALVSGLSIILRDERPLTKAFLSAARKYARTATDDAHAAAWLSLLVCVDAKAAIESLEKWVASSPNKGTAESRISKVLNLVWGDRDGKMSGQHQDFKKPEILQRLLMLSHAYVRIEDDISHEDVFSPGVRDHAQHARNHLTELLYQIPGRPTYDALLALSKMHSLEFPKDHMLVLAEQRGEADAESEYAPWSEADVSSFDGEAERNPTTQKELYDLALSRLDDMKLDLEEGDESEASLFRRVSDEIELRRVIANSLKQAAQGKYTTGSEEELADKTRTDIRLHNPAVEVKIPIELKIAGRWRSAQLRERLENQLIGQYMREARYGVYLVVNRGSVSDSKTWTVKGKPLAFAALVEWLGKETIKIARKHSSKIEGLSVVGIDLVRRDYQARELRRTSSAGKTKKRVERNAMNALSKGKKAAGRA